MKPDERRLVNIAKTVDRRDAQISEASAIARECRDTAVQALQVLRDARTDDIAIELAHQARETADRAQDARKAASSVQRLIIGARKVEIALRSGTPILTEADAFADGAEEAAVEAEAILRRRLGRGAAP